MSTIPAAAPTFVLLLLSWLASPSSSLAQTALPTIAGQECSTSRAGIVSVTFAWPRPAAAARQVWLDLSLVDNGFASGTFVGVGPLEPSTTAFTWDGIRPGLLHYFRLNVLYADGWRPSATGSFVSGLCLSPAAALQGIGQVCSGSKPGKVTVAFRWSPALLSGGTQWVDLSIFNNGFVPGTFLGMGPLPGSESVVVWDGLEPGTTHYWRVNTLGGDGWHPSASGAFTTLGCWDSSFSSASYPNEEMVRLRERLRGEIAASGINAAVAVTDLQTGESIDVAGDDFRLPGCTINFFVLLSVVMDLQASLYGEHEVGDLIARTVWSSNPVTARQLLIKTGGGDIMAGIAKINDLLARLGMWRSFYDHPPAYWGYVSLAGSINALTANDMNRALAHFYNGGVVSLTWRDYLLEKLTGVKPGLQYLIPAGVGAASVSHKNGFLWSPGGWVDNDAGIVIFSRGGTSYAYAISFFSQDVPNKYADIPLGQAVSSLVWQYFQARYP